jgi:hypothetical protein
MVFMKNKKVLVVGIALILMAIVAGVAFAGEMNGVSWYTSNGTTYITNNNDYRVRVVVSREGYEGGISQGIDAGATKSYDGTRSVTRVTRMGY